MKKWLIILLLSGCAKDPCYQETRVQVQLQCPDTKNLKYVQVHFVQGSRVVGADHIFPLDFKGDIFNLEYIFKDTDPDFVDFRVYSYAGWTGYGTHIFADTTMTNTSQQNDLTINFKSGKSLWLVCKSFTIPITKQVKD